MRGGAGTALVGDPATVAERMQEYSDLGIETFILSGYPHLEEAYRVADLLFSASAGFVAIGKSTVGNITGPFGELVANEYQPRTTAATPGAGATKLATSANRIRSDWSTEGES